MLLFCALAAGAAAAPGGPQTQRDTDALLEAMKRSNEAESDHRNIMTPEFRDFCITSREHVTCCATFLLLFVCAYAVVRRACTDGPRSLARGAVAGVRHLVLPYAAVFRSRQILLVIASAGLASAAMMAILLAVTVGLANAMEHGDPRSLRSWRTWLLPSTLLAPGDAQLGHLPAAAAALAAGPHVAHDFPPILRRLWLYQSIISVSTAAFLLPLGLLFEATSRRASTRSRLLAALGRWLAVAFAGFIGWEAACWRLGFLRGLGLYQPFSADVATIRYSVHFASCAFGLLPAVLATLPRGTWALFEWLRSCVGQQHELARSTRMRHTQLERERERIERQLEQAIGSWKWEQFRERETLAVEEPAPPPTPQTRGSMLHIPPAHPGLAAKPAARPYQTVAAGRSRVAPRRPRAMDVVLPARSSIQLCSPSADAVMPLRERSSSTDRGATSPHSPVLYYSSSASSSDNDGDGNATASDLQARRVVRSARKRLWLRREREMLELSRRIKRYHAQLLLIREEVARIDASGVLDVAGDEHTAVADAGPPRLALLLLAAAQRAAALLTMAAATVCWLLLVLLVGRGALSAIFVGEPDLTHSF
ncbi:hypothetical protein IWQ56_004310, partial [Coemansia nantahalensis]